MARSDDAARRIEQQRQEREKYAEAERKRAAQAERDRLERQRLAREWKNEER